MIPSVGLYVRVSTQEQAKDGYSIGEQIERLKSYCAALKWSVYNVYADAGYSGSTTNRPALQAMLADVDGGRIDKVLVYKLDRLSRSQKDTLALIEDRFLARNVDFVSVSENFDTASAFGRAMIGILAVFAQLEREQIKERMTLGRDARAKNGLYHGSANPPVGYTYTDGKLLKNDFEALQIQRIFAEYVAGRSKLDIAQDLNNNGLIHHYGKWTYKRIDTILRNPVYLGMINHCGSLVPGIHEKIISETLFADAQERIKRDGERHRGRGLRDGKAHSIFGGFMYCAKCGGKYALQTRYGAGGKALRYYACTTRRHIKVETAYKSCTNKTYRAEVLEEIIISEIKTFALNPDSVPANKSRQSEDIDAKAALTAEIARIDRQTARMMDLYAVEQIDLKALTGRLDALRERRAQLAESLESAEREEDNKPSRHEALTLAGIIDDLIASGDLNRIRNAISVMIERIIIDGEDITIVWNFD